MNFKNKIGEILLTVLLHQSNKLWTGTQWTVQTDFLYFHVDDVYVGTADPVGDVQLFFGGCRTSIIQDAPSYDQHETSEL